MSFGNQTVSFVSLAATSSLDSLGVSTLAETVTEAPRCRHRPITQVPRESGGVRGEESPETGVSVATQFWRTTVPVGEYSPTLRAAVLAVKSSDVLRVDGETYRIIGGMQPFTDFTGVFKATVVSEKQTIG